MLLIRLAETFYRHRILVLAPLVISLLLSGVLLKLQPRQYQATAVLMVARTTLEDPQSRQAPADVMSDVMVAELGTRAYSLAVVKRSGLAAATDLPGPGLYGLLERIIPPAPLSPGELEDASLNALHNAIRIEAGGPDTINVSAISVDARLSAAMANSAVHEFIETEVGKRRTDAKNQVAFYSDLIRQQEAEVAKADNRLHDYLAANPSQRTAETDDPTVRQLQRDLDFAKQSYEHTLPLLTDAQVKSAGLDRPDQSGYTVVDEAKPPGRPMGRLKTIALGLAAGAMLGLVIAMLVLFALTVTDTSVRREEELALLLGARPVAALPVVKPLPLGVGRPERARLGIRSEHSEGA